MSHPVFDISGRVALVTGSSKGIGNALARGLLEAGCTVVLNGREESRLAEAREELSGLTGATAHALAFDVTDPVAVADGIARAEELAGPIDVLVNNTGVQHRAPFTEFADADWYRLLDTNLSSAFLVGREVARRMVPRGSGKIINICSVQSELVRPGIAPYSATKGGLKQLTKGMCADLGPSGIQVNGLAPGYFETELTAALVADEEFSEWVRGRTPAGRWGRVSDLVGALLFLASPASDFVNGQLLHVDGGMTSVL
ncbi:gluconate 5-dehydrogenase [Saccharopolyspora kobensis]|uniref:Gluconate 5-dehydrogenase n=1 Tax=Saccharopolyspora kobensis TaxID=146035 RepID=A0A1H5ZPE9_9PSEU|nr:SDR family NAD(P)-dependent oxidoreductase [Saccharopolyspora kobensis]SEG37894.1 gluconate 5-dehydrogenase [Saccharopolyspora kobensis]SFF21938.1 gluconate 5-dehydrogenase [Saccharopolyspora kobensis]